MTTINIGEFPQRRLRRPRQAPWSRNLTAETALSVNDLIWAIVIKDGDGAPEPVASMPGAFRLSVKDTIEAAARAVDLGLPALALFPHTDLEKRSETANEAFNNDNLMCRAARAVKSAHPEIGLIGDVALDPYTDHGHDGFLEDGEIVNDRTVKALCEQAVILAEAGFDVVAPSDMMDGRIGAIRKALDEEKFEQVQILSYSAKYASGFYGPYRDAIGSSGVLKGDKRTYQMDPANSDEAIRETALDLSEGADMVMVKPGLAYLDILARIKQEFQMPTVVFQVSGEYAMIKAAAQNGWLDGQTVMMETLTAFKRAGADGIITYFAEEAAKILRG